MEKNLNLSWSQAFQLAALLVTLGGLFVQIRLNTSGIENIKEQDKLLKQEILREVKYLEDKHSSDNATLHRRITTTNSEVKAVEKEVHELEVEIAKSNK